VAKITKERRLKVLSIEVDSKDGEYQVMLLSTGVWSCPIGNMTEKEARQLTNALIDTVTMFAEERNT